MGSKKEKSLFSEVVDEIVGILASPFRKKKKSKKKTKKPINPEDLKALQEAIVKSQGKIELGEEEAKIVKTWLHEE